MLVLLLKISALAALVEREAGLTVLIVALTLSRWTAVALGAWLPYARAEGGIGEAATSSTAAGLAVATLIAAAAAVAVAGVGAAVLWAAVGVTTLGVGLLARARIGGVTGDIFGACVELSETAVLLTGLVLRRP